ncbi:hypothetical protein BC829DRAFT_4656 [Chytridium lagenaria]|nr:hypothetical protein BC829DRAFT_4656 [Chytridium lagenaria]
MRKNKDGRSWSNAPGHFLIGWNVLPVKIITFLGQKAFPEYCRKHHPALESLRELWREISERRETSTPSRTPPNRVLAPIARRIPEQKLKESGELKTWIQSHVGKNPHGIRVKPRPPDAEFLEPGRREKPAQGPFLPHVQLDKKRSKPLKPSLRVQTDFFDTVNYKREEKRLEIAKRVSDKVFATVRHIKYETKECHIGGGPYQRIKSFRSIDSSKFISKRDFKTIIPPVPLFEKLMDDY